LTNKKVAVLVCWVYTYVDINIAPTQVESRKLFIFIARQNHREIN